jgi:sec-independent protein translocase protein TatA
MSASTLLLAGIPGGWEIWIVLLILLLLFGRRIPQVARSLGQGINQFKQGLNESLDQGDDDEDEDERPARPKSREKKPEKEKVEQSDDE